MKFVMSYSGGKDSCLALHRMLAAGHVAMGLLVTFNSDKQRSWFHGADFELLTEISDALEIPLQLCPCGGENYHKAFEQALLQAKDMGAEACAFGDIDLADNAAWCRERCENVHMEPVFPLWGERREALVREFLTLGYRAVFKCVDNRLLPKSLLGKYLTEETLEVVKDCGADAAGENGEYHTLVLDGPAFVRPVRVRSGERLDFGTLSVLDITAQKEGPE